MKYALIISLLLWGLIFSVASAWADYLLPIEPIRIQMTRIPGAHAMPPSKVSKMARAIERYGRAYGFIFKVSVRSIRYPWQPLKDCQADDFSTWHFEMLKYQQPGVIQHVLLPPPRCQGRYFIGGNASQCSINSGGLSVSYATMRNAAHVKRYLHSLAAALHEIFHALGANHINTLANIMHEDALPKVTKKPLPLMPRSISEILRCMKG